MIPPIHIYTPICTWSTCRNVRRGLATAALAIYRPGSVQPATAPLASTNKGLHPATRDLPRIQGHTVRKTDFLPFSRSGTLSPSRPRPSMADL